MKKRTKCWIGCGIFCVLFLLVSTWYAITWNDSRLVVPMNFETYHFQVKDLPMILSLSLVSIYAIALFVTLMCSKRHQCKKSNMTRTLNPKLGLLGLFGFLGFGGFWTYAHDGSIFPFVFFVFFGFFGFYYEGKMSGTFMDERFRENAAKANLKASNLTFSIIFIALIMLSQGKLFGSLEYTFIAVTITLSLALGLRTFLSEYLLYRYDHDDQAEESEE